MGYEGPPRYAPIPLGIDELAAGAAAPSDDDLEGFEVGAPLPETLGDIPPVKRLDGVPGTAGLKPFPGDPGCPTESVIPYPERYPNIEVAQKGAHFFSQWGDRTGGSSGDQLRTATPSSWAPYRLIRSPKVPGGGSSLWMVDIWGYEIIRTPLAEEGPVSPLGDDIMLRSGGAASAVEPGNMSSKLKARIMWWASSGGTTRIVDIAQGVRCALKASLVTVEILYPTPGTVQVKQDSIGSIPNPPLLAAEGGTVLDTIVGVSIVPTTSTPGQQLTTNTMIVEPLIGQADVPIFIPPGTRSVSVYQSSAGSLMTPTWRFGRLAANPLAELGTLDLGGQRRAERLARPGAAGMIQTGPADPVFDRLATFIFELEI
jgi:hypothetical protein